MSKNTPKTIRLQDYTPPAFQIDTVFMHFDLNEDVTRVKTVLTLHRNPDAPQAKDLQLNGEDMRLLQVLVDGQALTHEQYQVTDDSLTVFAVPDSFTLETEVELEPQNNSKLSGLYKSGPTFCTQCESHGFRRITYYLDRPDVLSRFTVSISADKDRYPVLLSNGNLIESKQLDNNRQWVKWEDPSLKPAYLFALVAGDLDHIEDTFITQSGRNVELRVYVEKGKKDQSHHAMESLKHAMAWDEEAFDREYELDIYMIVAVNDFNFGAMENKGLNIFNDKYILAQKETATDEDFVNIESVIGHEYFHNWSGNRVTVRDWFQITLKEGLTIFRDQSFIADITDKAVKRIHDANVIRNVQFTQDAGPMAHPIRTEEYIEINNFYTVTVYNKGAEVIRMMQTLLGEDKFREAMVLYFTRNDGKAVRTEEFVQAMEDASGIDLTQFKRWYRQAGTPELTITDDYNAETNVYKLTVKQFTPATPGQKSKDNFHIPLSVGLLNEKGGDLLPQSAVLNVKETEQTFTFENIMEKPLPSLLRNFSAPVKVHYDYSDSELLFLMTHDSDAFNRWIAGQKFAEKMILRLVADQQAHKPLELSPAFAEAILVVLNDKALNPAFIAEMLILPAESFLIQQMKVADVEAIHNARDFVKLALAKQLRDELLQHYAANHAKEYHFDAQAAGKRRLKNVCLMYLGALGDERSRELCLQQYQQADNMTDKQSALGALNNVECAEREQMLNQFFDEFQREPLVMDKWFAMQATSSLPSTLAKVKSLLEHPSFDIRNPNKARSLIGAFGAGNQIRFHDNTGEGYQFLTEQVLSIDQFNPMVAARLIEPLTRWQRFDSARQELMKEQLQRIVSAQKLSNDVYEIASKSLNV